MGGVCQIKQENIDDSGLPSRISLEDSKANFSPAKSDLKKGGAMSPVPEINACPHCGRTRREFLSALAVAGAGAFLLPGTASGEVSDPTAQVPQLNGSTEPFPIPWLDKNGSHNQSPGPGMDPSNIFHFKGQVARCNNFTGMGTDNKGNRIAFGAPSTDFSFMSGEYFAARAPQKGIFSHI